MRQETEEIAAHRLLLASGDRRRFLQAKKVEIGEHRRCVSLFHRHAARAAGIIPFHPSTTLDQHLASASGIGAMPAVFRFHAHGRSLLRGVFLCPTQKGAELYSISKYKCKYTYSGFDGSPERNAPPGRATLEKSSEFQGTDLRAKD